MMYGGGKMWKTDSTTKVVNEYPLPRGGKQMERFLGYYSNFVEDYAGRVTRLRVLARKKRWKGSELASGTQEREDFQAIKAALAERMKLEKPDWTKEFIVKADLSKTAMGAALLQEGDNGKLRWIRLTWQWSRRQCKRSRRSWRMDGGSATSAAAGYGVAAT